MRPSRLGSHLDLLLRLNRVMDVRVGYGCRALPEKEFKSMRFEVTSEGHILTDTEDLSAERERSGTSFGTEEELKEMAGAWPMKKLIEIWNGLPGVPRVQKFENRRIAIARIWRAIAGRSEPAEHAAPARKALRSGLPSERVRKPHRYAHCCRGLRERH